MLKTLSNRRSLLVFVGVLFVIWMLFFDENSYLSHRELNKEIDKTQKTNKFYKKQIKKDQKMIQDLKNPDSLEKFGREEYLMKKKNEAIFIIDGDSIKQK